LVVAAVLALGASRADAQQGGAGFLFVAPRGSAVFSGGFSHANAASDIFAHAEQFLTLKRGDFDALHASADVAMTLTPRFDVVFSASYAGSSAPSEFRDWLDQNDLPIQQTTSFRRVPVTAAVKAYVVPQGRQIGHYAWLPNRVFAYVGAGGGAIWYRFRQTGDFVDFNTSDVYTDDFQTSAWAPAAVAMTGLGYSISPRYAITTEGRYLAARGKVSQDFAGGFHRIDLSSLTTSLGFSVRF
jgi:hypothetical protein